MVRTPCCDKTGLKKGTWTPEEDRKLMAYVKTYGSLNWRQLPKYAGLARCGKSCRLRWMNYLRPNIKRGNYTKEEEDTIIKLHESLGNKWSAIAAQLPGRTDNEIKNHWHTNLKKRKKQNSTATELEEKVNLSHISPCETSKEKEILMEVPTINYSSLNPTTHQILESSPFSPQPSLSELSSSSTTTDTAAVSSSNLVAYDDGASYETYEIFSGTFWTEPFVADSAYNFTNDFMVPSVEPGLLYGVYDGDDGLNW